ncbi:MAG: hypothetical protein IH987_15285 [Planctomycetes bacterium]|nr:hypothetical protein [Planctomycetota bacterium]
MNESADTTPIEPTSKTEAASDMPLGDHPLEVAARTGFGPLSSKVGDAWHGEAVPCVSCGHLVRRTQDHCDECGQDLGARMLAKMRTHAGPWYVLEHLHPFPGVTLDRIIRQIRRGLLTETSIVRGPSTDHQWRFAVETPGLCRYFGRCWHCHNEVAPSDSTCTRCRTNLNFDQSDDLGHPATSSKRANAHGSVVLEPTAELRELSAALGQAGGAVHESNWETAPRIGGIRASWIAAFLVVVVIALLIWFTGVRKNTTAATSGLPARSALATTFPSDASPRFLGPRISPSMGFVVRDGGVMLIPSAGSL